eukprot:15047048-Alexandrium_andersonii.AAC.1
MLEAESAAEVPKVRGRRTEDDRAAVLKYLNDHFKGLTNEEKFVLTLEARLQADRELWKAR